MDPTKEEFQEGLSIEQLPEEILMKILSFLPNRMNYVTVCRKFYELICEIDKSKYKMVVGSIRSELIDKTWIANTRRKFDTLDVYIDLESAEDVDLVHDVFRYHGENIKNLEWSNWNEFEFIEDDLVDMLNCMPNLEDLQLNSWFVEFLRNEEKSQNVLNMPKLEKLDISECGGFLVEFLVEKLPQNILKQFKIDSIASNATQKLLKKQNTIEILDIDITNYTSVEAFKSLNLKHLQCALTEKQSPSTQRAFLKALIESQPGLISLNTLIDRDYSFSYVNDEVFEEITKCQFLKSLKINIDGITGNGVRSFGKLKNLKTLELKTNLESSLESFLELSLLKLPLESLTLRLWRFEIPQLTYQQFGENFNLKSLTITLGTWHQINFFIESFPNLESLSIRFGTANKTVELSQVFNEDDLKVHKNLKSLELQFWGDELITCEKFLKLLSCFPNLKKLNVNSKFEFGSAFLSLLVTSLNKINNLTIIGIKVEREETFPPEIIDCLKKIAKKFKSCHLMLKYSADSAFFSSEDFESGNVQINVFTFEPLKIALKEYFKMEQRDWRNVKINKHLRLMK